MTPTAKQPTPKTPKGAIVRVYFPDLKDAEAIRAAAKRDGRSVSQWCAMRLCEAARKAR